MKKRGILHSEISEVIATLGHGDMLVVGDAGLPVPPGVRRIDLAVAGGVPGFIQVLRALLEDVQVESAVLASEMAGRSPQMYADTIAALGVVPVRQVSHEDFKQMTRGARAIIRTGEFTPYANVILVSGVVF
jgi:D-ribose pyranase